MYFLSASYACSAESGLGGAALAQIRDRFIEILRRHPRVLKQSAGRRIGCQRQRQQQHFHGNEGVLVFLGGLFRLVEHPGHFRRQVKLAGAGAFHFRQLRQLLFHQDFHLRGIASGGAHQACGQPLAIVQQRLEHVFGGKALMPVADSDGLRGL